MTSNENMDAALANAQILAKFVDAILNGNTNPPDVGFALFFFPNGGSDSEKRPVGYVGNCKREDVFVAMKEVIAQWEGQPYQEGTV